MQLSQLENWYDDQKGTTGSCLYAMRQLILNFDQEMTETMKYGMPCFCLRGKMFCYLWKDKQSGEPYILVVEGQQIDHPALEVGDRKRMKILRINPHEDLPVDLIQEVLNLAKAFY